ncbi:unnamed protein product [Schistocephalus solidus]|uniref:CS domain n=1 Tax=Schistocephalus solidus TaxID=70667 RepID=A0A183T787_SCHSO|nr:unnamed protein product [Schistocephalus solidus]
MPTVTVDEVANGNIRVTILIDNLRAQRSLNCICEAGVEGRFFADPSAGDGAACFSQSLSNGQVKCKLDPWSLSLSCTLSGRATPISYRVNQFPSEIRPNECSYKVKNGKVILFLRKADPAKSWIGDLNARGLDQAAS